MARTASTKNNRNNAPSTGTRSVGILPRKIGKGFERLRSSIDWPFAILVLILLAIGTIFVFSSSFVYAKYNLGDSFHFIKKQIFWVCVSVALMIIFAWFADYLFIKKLAIPIYLTSIGLLVLSIIIGSVANGAKRWIYIGTFSFQPSEVAKFAIIVILADYIVKLDNKDKDRIRTFRYGILNFGLFAAPIAILLIMQPHLSATVIILALVLTMMWLAGPKQSTFWISVFTAALLMICVFLMTSHGQERIQSFFHKDADIQNTGWQAMQSLYAIGSGGLWGLGLGGSKQKHLYLPEPQNDYIFAIVCEEMGFVFAVAVIILFVLLIWRGYRIAKNAPSKFSSLLVMGIMTQIGIQVFLNIAVVTGSIPSTGVSLPFFSYGGSALMLFMAEMGVVLNVSKYSYIEKS